MRKCVNRKYNKRPLEMKYLWVAKATGYSYKQVRNVFDKMCKSGLIEKFHKWTKVGDSYRQTNFYRRI